MPMTKPEIDGFLREPRIGVLCTNEADRSPHGIPVWFEWDGDAARIFSYAALLTLTVPAPGSRSSPTT